MRTVATVAESRARLAEARARISGALLVVSSTLLTTGCGSSESLPGTPNGQAGGGATAGAPSVDLSYQNEPTECPELPTVAATQAARLGLQMALELGGAPFGLGEATSDGQGGTDKLSFLAYYLTNFWLIDLSGRAHAAVMLGADDAPLPYGLRLVNVDDPSTQRLRLAVEPGQYRALSFSIGVPAACNALDLTTRGYPLTLETEMNWGWTMLNLRLEGSHVGADGNYALEYHIGFPEDFRTAEVPAALDLRTATLERSLALQVDKVLGIDQPTEAVSYPDIVNRLNSSGTFLLR